MSITTLYRTSLNTSKQHYNAGYSAALRDLLVVIQQGVSVGGAGNDEDAGMSIGRIMDWIDARLDAIKAREEEEDEEERESSGKSRMRKSTPGVSGVSTSSVIPSSSTTTTISGEKRKPEAVSDFLHKSYKKHRLCYLSDEFVVSGHHPPTLYVAMPT